MRCMPLIGVLCLLCLVPYTLGAVYEARNSDDVDFFLQHNPEENGALMFYDPQQESAESDISDNASKIIGIFKNINEEGRTEEDWVNDLNDKVHLMRVDATNLDNTRSVQDYKVETTPLLVLLDAGKIILMEEVSDKTFDHVKDILVEKEQEKQAAADAAKAEADGGDEFSKANQDEIEAAHKAAEDALAALEELRQTFEQHLEVEKAEKEAKEAQAAAEQAQKELEEADAKVNQGNDQDGSGNDDQNNGDDGQCPSGNNNQQNNNQNNNGQNQGNNQNQNGQNGQQQQQPQIVYVPVYTRLGQQPVIGQQPAQGQTTQQATSRVVQSQPQQTGTRVVQQPQQTYWTIVDNQRR